ncbi:hypothetical protein [Nonomuraea sp. CA-141351]|uniref:hypothetical protein n=1 Tax=Nonomuraea sp. CA-141351 TaxID=3239996 RepID=UPI003D912C8F
MATKPPVLIRPEADRRSSDGAVSRWTGGGSSASDGLGDRGEGLLAVLDEAPTCWTREARHECGGQGSFARPAEGGRSIGRQARGSLEKNGWGVMKKTGPSTGTKNKRQRRRTIAGTEKIKPGISDMSDVPITKRDVSVASPSVSTSTPPGWQKFTEKPDSTTAKVVAQALRDTTSVRRMAGMLAQRSAYERSTMSRLIVAQLRGNLALDFLKATAGVRLVKPETPQKQVPQPEDGRDPGRNESLEALDLAAPRKGAIDLVELAKRTDDADDASSIAYLKKALADINLISSGKTPYSELRRKELGKVAVAGQAHLVKQVGFRTASSKRTGQSNLSTQHDLVSSYWRTSFGEALQEFAEKLQADGKLKEGDILVNSPRVLRKLGMVLDPKVLAKLEIKPLKGETGISVLRGVTDSSLPWKDILEGIGATPSAYQLYELMDADKPPLRPNFTVDAHADLAQLITSSAFSRLQDIARGKGELAPACAMVEHLLLGLTDKLGPYRHDALTADALRSLSRLLDIVVEDPNPSTALRAVDLMMDEIAVVLAVAKNYGHVDYWKTMQDVLLKRAPSIAPNVGREIELSSHLMTSGMDALGTALYIALSGRRTGEVSRATEKVDYFETGMLLGKLKKGEVAKPRKDVVVAALNPSTPFESPSAKNLVEGVLEGLKTRKPDDPPHALILDTTVEEGLDLSTGRTRLDEVLSRLKGAIADGSLEVFLCKSFQKYASFGTGKVAAGDLTVLSKKGGMASQRTQAEARLQELDLDLARHDEGQLVIHMLKHGNQDEQALMRSAAGNAQFVNKFCWPVTHTDLGSPYVDGIPLLLRSKPGGQIAELFQKLTLVDWRGSFSFLRTSFVDLIPGPWGATDQQEDWYTRINTGHESKQTMVEYFYAFGHLATGMPPGAKKPTTEVNLKSLNMKDVKDHWDALGGVKDEDDADIARYRDSIMASYCAYACQNVLFKPDVLPMLIAFFARPTTGVSIETRRYLAGELLARANLTAVKPLDAGTLTDLCERAMVGFKIPGMDKPDATVTLAALCRAAEVLPNWSMKPFAQGLMDKLKRSGDSTEAQRLRDLLERAIKA